MNEQIDRGLTWYQRAIEWPDLVEPTPPLEPYLNFEKYPVWVFKMAKELFRQSLHLAPKKDIASITAQEAGKLLGQMCANGYVVQNHRHAELEKQRNAHIVQIVSTSAQRGETDEAVASMLHKKNVSDSMVSEYEKHRGEILGKIQLAFS